MEKKLYFEKPTQVLFYDDEVEGFIAGIAYGDEIICGCCGSIFSIEEIYELAPTDVEPILVCEDWTNLDEIISQAYWAKKEVRNEEVL